MVVGIVIFFVLLSSSQRERRIFAANKNCDALLLTQHDNLETRHSTNEESVSLKPGYKSRTGLVVSSLVSRVSAKCETKRIFTRSKTENVKRFSNEILPPTKQNKRKKRILHIAEPKLHTTPIGDLSVGQLYRIVFFSSDPCLRRNSIFSENHRNASQ